MFKSLSADLVRVFSKESKITLEGKNMKIKILQGLCLSLLLSVLISCSMLKNRKPQSAGSTAYCSNCLVEEIDKDMAELRDTVQKASAHFVKNEAVKTPVEVRSVVVFDNDGKPVCSVDLSKHPELVPSFAKPSSDKMVHQASKSKRGLASVDDEFESLPPCTSKYLSELKKVAKNSVVINGDKSYMHKTSIRILGEVGAACAVGGSAGIYVNKKYAQGDMTPDSAKKGIISATGTMGVSMPMAVASDFRIDKLTRQLEKELPDMGHPFINEGKKINKKIDRLKKIKRGGIMGVSASACYVVGSLIGITLYR